MPLIVLAGTVNLDSLIKRTRAKVLDDEPWEDLLTTAISDASSVLQNVNTLQPARWAEGDIGEFDDATGSVFRVTSLASPNANPFQVKMGHKASPIAAHVINTIIRKEPRFTYDLVQENILRIIASQLWPHVYNVNTYTLTPAPSASNIYATPPDYEFTCFAEQKNTDSITQISYYGRGGGTLPIEEMRGADPALAASGIVWRFPSSFYNLTNPVIVTYGSRITSSTVPDDDRAELVVLGAAERIVATKEVPLTGVDMSFVPPPGSQPGQLLRDALYFQQRFKDLRRSIRADLWRRYPPARTYQTGNYVS